MGRWTSGTGPRSCSWPGAAEASPYARAIISTLALRAGWREDQVQALLAGRDTGEGKLDTLAAVVREAAANSSRVSGPTWEAAAGLGWGEEQLAEASAYLGLTVFTSYFLNYAAPELDVPTAPARAGEGA
jgi:hypothetical protein